MRSASELASPGDISRACAIAECETQSQNHIFPDCAFGVRHFRLWNPPIDGRSPRQSNWRPFNFESGYEPLIPFGRATHRDANWAQLLLLKIADHLRSYQLCSVGPFHVSHARDTQNAAGATESTDKPIEDHSRSMAGIILATDRVVLRLDSGPSHAINACPCVPRMIRISLFFAR
jgi:hypothetical protein